MARRLTEEEIAQKTSNTGSSAQDIQSFMDDKIKSLGSGFSQPKSAPSTGASDMQAAFEASQQGDQKVTAFTGEMQQNAGVGGAAGDGSGGNSYEPGLFNFGQVMEDFYNYQPAEGDTLGQLQKSAYQGNLVQTAFDAQVASGLAEQNAALAQENMAQQADLEKLNSLDLMQAEFGYNQLSQEANFEYENSFANSQYDRDVGMLTATGEQQRDNIREQSNQDRLTDIVQGEQQRLTDAQNIESAEKIATGQYASNDYRAEVAADASKFGASEGRAGAENVAETQAGANMYGADKSKEAATEVATTQAGASMYGSDKSKEASVRSSVASENVATTRGEADKDVARTAAGASMYGADQQLAGVKDTNTTSTRNIRTTGDETRSTQNNEQRLKARERADMSRYSRSMARAN